MNPWTPEICNVRYFAKMYAECRAIARHVFYRNYYVYHYDAANYRAKLECTMAIYRVLRKQHIERSLRA